uniref:Uncharacterized protein n=1 Tax=Rhizophora mucronata TaxID=61149 RepID=A0A2P2JET5_RHIMU
MVNSHIGKMQHKQASYLYYQEIIWLIANEILWLSKCHH